MTDKLINTLKTKLVAAELRALGITDQAQVLAVAARTRIDANTGAIIGLNADGADGVGSGPNYTLSVADVAQDLGATGNETTSRSSAASAVRGNPFRAGPDFSLTGQMVLMKSDPVLAEDMAAAAGVSLARNAS